MKTIHEKARQTPVVRETEVLVCGGGPAGVCAAIAAGRTGADVTLLEAHGCLGGIWTSGLLAWVLDKDNKVGLMRQITSRLDDRNARRHNAYDVELMKRVLEQMCAEANVQVRYHTRVCAGGRDEHNRLAAAITESKSGREAWAAKVFVDCTGDGDLAARSGCGFEFGQEETGRTQPMSMICLITGIDPDQTRPFHDRADEPWAQPKDALMAEFRKAGLESSYGKPTIFHLYDDLYIWMINHEYGVSGLDAQDITDATLRARAELHTLIDGLRSLGGCWANIRIVATPEQIGVREGRRIHGRYTVDTNDLATGARFDDAVCRVTFGVDVHALDPKKNKGIDGMGVKAQPYDIPLRALIAKDVDGLMMAGRCISGDFLAHSSYRVTGNAVAMGQAAGAGAAVAAKAGDLPHEVPFENVKAAMETL